MQDGFYAHRQWVSAFLLVLAGLIFLGFGCGKKGPPRPPLRPLPPVVNNLEYTIHDDIVELSWSVPAAGGDKAAPPAAVKVFRSRLTAAEAGCENCPVRYSVAADIPILQKRSEKSKPIKSSYTEFVESGYRYIYKVNVFYKYGISGKDSNIIKFDH